MNRTTEEILDGLEEKAASKEAARARRLFQANVRTAREHAEMGRVKAAMRPVFRTAVERAAPILDRFLQSPEWERLLTVIGKLRGSARPEELSLPSLFLSRHPGKEPGAARAVFKGEKWSVSPYDGGVFWWTIGKQLKLTTKRYFMQPPQVVFRSDSGLLALLPWFERTSVGDGSPQAALRLCELVCESRLLEILAEGEKTE
jgi:plasmid stabilization system protein ParE